MKGNFLPRSKIAVYIIPSTKFYGYWCPTGATGVCKLYSACHATTDDNEHQIHDSELGAKTIVVTLTLGPNDFEV